MTCSTFRPRRGSDLDVVVGDAHLRSRRAARTLDIANSALFIASCANERGAPELHASRTARPGLRARGPEGIEADAITFEEAYFVFGFGRRLDGSIAPWIDETQLQSAPITKSTQLTWAANIAVPGDKCTASRTAARRRSSPRLQNSQNPGGDRHPRRRGLRRDPRDLTGSRSARRPVRRVLGRLDLDVARQEERARRPLHGVVADGVDGQDRPDGHQPVKRRHPLRDRHDRRQGRHAGAELRPERDRRATSASCLTVRCG